MASASFQKQSDLFARGMKEAGWHMFKAAMEHAALVRRTKARLRAWKRKASK